MENNNQDGLKKILAVLTLVILVVLVFHIVRTVSFNSKVHTAKGPDDSKASYLDIGKRDDSTSSWVKRDFKLNGKKVDLKANTFDAVFHNNDSEEISSWKLRQNIKGDCFINNAWCGTMEIHQFVGTKDEKVQKIDLRNYKLKDVKLKHLYDGDLLIPLKKGDYVIYYPSKKDDEVPIGPKSELTIGSIFYYVKDIDLSDYKVTYHYHKAFTEGMGAYATAILLLLWLGFFIMMQVARIYYKRAMNDMENRMSGIKYMADIYDIIYQADIEMDELRSLVADEGSEDNRPRNMGARDQLLNLFMYDAEEPYMELMQEFADISTLNERLTKESIACNYLSKTHGGSQIRFFAMDRKEGEPLRKVLFTIQNIHDEKSDLAENEIRVSKSDSEKKAKSVFFDILAERVGTTVDILNDSTAKLAGSDDEQVRSNAEIISQESESLMQITDKLKNASELYAGTLRLEPEEYSFSQLMQDVCQEAERAIGDKEIEFKTNISGGVPDKLYGDRDHLYQIISYLLTNSADHTESGTITFAVFGNRREDKEHLLISVKDTGRGIREEDLKRLTEHWAEADESWSFSKEEPGMGLTMIHEMLRLMDSGLHIISEYGSGSEFYFEIEQPAADSE